MRLEIDLTSLVLALGFGCDAQKQTKQRSGQTPALPPIGGPQRKTPLAFYWSPGRTQSRRNEKQSRTEPSGSKISSSKRNRLRS